ncbi:patatin-like protein [Oscillatoria sp. FACHB-1406]|uniref:patatin-like protein n=1 Tax=Oscillatoria sp. FACHB-1406 TaxID=2692846 RepID=UPI0016888179|nr:patatin-like protein [Oscillatoria sp. FACHB-1406]MBD2579385.1 patatin-like protein [Oscillatoria sp. FACHB-1406]
MKPTASQSFPQPDFQRELRLGLVVYGGVSLAVYMNGVCREFYNAVRGRGVYKLVKALTDSDIVVDIVSGTSAGGINGILLSYALANSNAEEVVEFSTFGRVWRESGNIRKLLHQPNEAEGRESLFDGEGYYQGELEEALRLAEERRKSAPADDWHSEFNELDLFVTGTDWLGRVYSVFDDTGAAIEVKEHRALFHLKHRQGRKTPFAALGKNANLTYQALAKLCRITSCFPVAFPTVTVKLQEREETADSYLVEWGALNNRLLPKASPEKGYQLHFVDGGVLDNRPFSHTIKEIYYRTANRPVERKLLYIDPSPDRFSDGQRFKQMNRPNVLQVVEDSLVGMPRYESITNDIELIKERNEKVKRYNSLLANAEADAVVPSRDASLQDSTLPPSDEEQNREGIYLLSQLIGLRDRVLPLILGMDGSQSLTSIEEFSQRQALLEKVSELLIQPLSPKVTSSAYKTLLAASQQIRYLDVEYPLRQHFYLLEKLHSLLERVRNVSESQKIRILIERLNRQIKLLEVVRAGLEQLLSHPAIATYFNSLIPAEWPPQNEDELRNRIYYLLIYLHRLFLDADGSELNFLRQTSAEDGYNLPFIFQDLPERAKTLVVPDKYCRLTPQVVGWLPQQQLSHLLTQCEQKIARIVARVSEMDSISLSFTTLNNDQSFLKKIEEASQIIIQNSGLKNADYLSYSFDKFQEFDEVLYPFEYLANINEKQPIKTIRVSPGDAQMGLGKGKGLDEKLAGNTLSAFGGFFKKSWRSNDILWGRLDGLNRLLEASLTADAVDRFPRFLRRQAREFGIDVEENPAEFEAFVKDYIQFLLNVSFSDLSQSDREKLSSYLERLATPGLNLSNAELQEIIEGFVLQGQREIINSDLLTVVEDEISEQVDWNYQSSAPSNVPTNDEAKAEFLQTYFNKNPRPSYNLERGYFEKNVGAIAAAAIAQESLAKFSQTQQEKEDFFRTRYRVGKETLNDNIPPLVLTNITTRSALVFRDLLNTLLGKNANRFRRSVPYKFINSGLQVFYYWLQFKGPLALESPNFRSQSKFRVVLQLVQFLLFLGAIILVILIVMSSPRLAIAAGICVAVGVLLGLRD